MAKDKERSINPAQQQRKLEKAKQLKKNRTEVQGRRNEKLARRNPERLQRQIDDIKALEAAGDIKPREKAILEELERDLKAVKKARDALGEKAPAFGGGQRRREGDANSTILGKRRFDGERKQERRREPSGSDTDDSVRRIPMPEDTPPPVPREHRRYFPRGGQVDAGDEQPNTTLPSKPSSAPAVKTTYESAPQVRDLRKEAINRFVPDVVRKKQEAAKGGPTGRLLEPEELDRLEAEGYMGRTDHERQADTVAGGDEERSASKFAEEESARKLALEEARFRREIEMQDQDVEDQTSIMAEPEIGAGPGLVARPSRHVEIEEVEDEDA